MIAVSQDVADRLARLESSEAIRALVARYAIGADKRNDPDIMGPLFADDAVWEAEGFTKYVGRDVIAKGLAEVAASQILWTVHYMVSPLIELDADGNSARCRWYLWELATMDNNGRPEDRWLGGWYDSKLRRETSGWKFAHVVLDIRLLTPAARPWDGKKMFDKADTFFV